MRIHVHNFTDDYRLAQSFHENTDVTRAVPKSWFGFGALEKKSAFTSKVSRAMKDVVYAVWTWASAQKPMVKVHSPAMARLLEEVGARKSIEMYPHVPMLQAIYNEGDGSAKWEQFELPSKEQIDSLWTAFTISRAKEQEYTQHEVPNEQQILPTILARLKNSQTFLGWTYDRAKLMAIEVAHRYRAIIAAARTRGRPQKPLECLTTRDLTLIPVSEEKSCSLEEQNMVIRALKKKTPLVATPVVAGATLPIVHSKKEAKMKTREEYSYIEEEIAIEDYDNIDERDWGDDGKRSQPPDTANDKKFQNSPIHEAKYWHYDDPVRLNEIWDVSKNIGRRFTDEGVQFKINRIVIYETDPQEWLFYEYYEEKHDDEESQNEEMHYTRCDHFEGGKYYGTMPGQKEDWFRWYDDDDDDDDDDDCNVDA
jgi:hypothetical protein